MAVLQMQRLSICALKKDRKSILELLQQKGVVEIERLPDEDESLQRMDTAGERAVFEKNANVADNALEILQIYVPEKKSMLSSLEGKLPVDYDSYSSIVKRQNSIMSKANKIISLSRNIAENKANIVKRENQRDALEPWKSLDVPMDFAGTGKTAAFIGTLPGAYELEQIYEKIAEAAPELEAVDVHVVSADRDQTYICVLCGKKDSTAMEDALRSIGFARPAQLVKKVPTERQKDLEQKIEALKAENGQLEAEIVAFEPDRQDLRMVSDYYRTRAAKYEVLGGLLQSKKTFVLTGYVPKQAADSLKEELDQNFTLAVEIQDLAEGEEGPVLLKNNSFSSSFEGIVGSFGLPKLGEIDPTTIMSFFYFFLFGLMLSDAAYGFIVFLACFIVLKKFPRMGEGMRKSLKMFMYCGISTLIWGILFGGYFGDIVDVVAQNYFGVTLAEGQQVIPALWFVPLNDPMKMLMYSMLFGLIHLFVGLGIKGYVLIKNGNVMDAVWDVGLWFIFLAGLLLLLLPSAIFQGISGIAFPAGLATPGKYLAIVGLVGILFMSARTNKNFGLRIALGAYDIYGVTSWLSDVLSYSRLLALGLATGVIASVINQMGSMLGTGVIGTILFIVIFIVGHTLNLAINLLGAYVHTNRLQFVEFFGKFYEGGGRPFNPFTTNTKYVDIKEEIKL